MWGQYLKSYKVPRSYISCFLVAFYLLSTCKSVFVPFFAEFSNLFIFYRFNWNRFTTCVLHQSVYVLNIKPTKSNTFPQYLSIRAAATVLRPQAKKPRRSNKKTFSKRIKQIFNGHLFLEKKVTHPRCRPLDICTSFPLLSGTICSNKQFFHVEAIC